LAAATPGVLLVTATPEQLGRRAHFARLRLLDPARYDNLDAYLAEAEGYVELSLLADDLSAGATLDDAQRDILRRHFAGDTDLLARLGRPARASLDALVYRHGTGPA